MGVTEIDGMIVRIVDGGDTIGINGVAAVTVNVVVIVGGEVDNKVGGDVGGGVVGGGDTAFVDELAVLDALDELVERIGNARCGILFVREVRGVGAEVERGGCTGEELLEDGDGKDGDEVEEGGEREIGKAFVNSW